MKKKRFVIGVTGGIASGKSTVLAMLKRKGIPVISSDELAHACIKWGQPAYIRILREFGPGILDSDREIDRKTLGTIVFQNPKARKRLESFVHPCVIRKLKQFTAKHTGPIALDIPLLFEAKLRSMADHVLVVYSNKAQQIARLKKRNGLSRPDAFRRLQAQWPLIRKRQLADSVLMNTGTLARLELQTQRWLKLTLDS